MGAPPGSISVRARFRAVPGVLADGQPTELRVDSSGALVTTGAGGGGVVIVQFSVPSSFNTTGAGATSGVIRATPGTLLDVNGVSVVGALRFFQLFNLVAVPANGTVPLFVVRVPAVTNFSVSFADSMGMSFGTGITWACSTTAGTLTLTATADFIVNAQHRAP